MNNNYYIVKTGNDAHFDVYCEHKDICCESTDKCNLNNCVLLNRHNKRKHKG